MQSNLYDQYCYAVGSQLDNLLFSSSGGEESEAERYVELVIRVSQTLRQP